MGLNGKWLCVPCRVPKELADETLQQLHSAGYAHASIVGSVHPPEHIPQAQQQSRAMASTQQMPVAKQIVIVRADLSM